jgi:hypothetical protein
MTLRLLVGNFCWVALIVAPIAFWSNLLNISVFTFQSPRCTILKFANELVHPVPTPYRAAIDWINGHVQPGQSIAVLPNYYMYPLMFHCPQAIYAWQLQPEQRSAPEFKDLPPIHFMGQDTPNYIIAFGPVVGELIRGYHPPLGINYALSDILDVYWKDAYRPELMWRTFVPIPVNKDQGTAIYIFKKSLVPVQPAPPSPTQPPPSPPSDFHL